ncbi:hypothetical protein EJ04DRAFT_490792 [Polyplosphaeria fusca]|uniref:SAP domain-containing protein n=1 Tax=Polyplosphaeria fusca TaxID=682080 RepID=A0A9P4V434_9PLEO|nr:hypothetical protein EJ04DRAFT_490792 [Polyplosphaeria fusca]
MSETYEKQTVANLRKLLKERGIPSTGLTKKQQIIDKLVEQDLANEEAAEASETADAPSESQPEPDNVSQEKDDVAAAEVAAPAQLDSQPEPTVQPGNTQAEESQRTSSAHTLPADAATAQSTASQQEPAPEPSEAPPTEIPQPKPTEDSQPHPEPESQEAMIETQAQTETQVTDFAIKTQTPPSTADEKPSIEKPELPPIPERSTQASSVEASRLNSEEREADTRKRKRRSQSPALSTQEVKAKKARPSDSIAPNVHLPEDNDVVMDQRQPEEGIQKENVMGNNDAIGKVEQRKSIPDEGPPTTAENLEPTDSKAQRQASRMKEPIQPKASTISPALEQDDQDDRVTTPALHTATPALYICNLKRPVQPKNLRSHLVAIATPPSADKSDSIIDSLFLDPMRTHALVLFSSLSAASRARASLHSTKWPDESREELWVDFVPEDKILSWIQQEEEAITTDKDARAAGQRSNLKRFEVVYPQNPDGSGVQAIFREVGSSAPVNAPKGPRADPVYAPPNEVQRQPAPAPAPPAKADQEKSFQTLDALFCYTTAKPKLYYLPVKDEISKRRLDELDGETSRDWSVEDRVRGRGRGRLDDKVAFSFDENDRLVEVGGDFGPWAEDSREGGGYRGGRGRGGFGGYRGGGRGGGYFGGRGR